MSLLREVDQLLETLPNGLVTSLGRGIFAGEHLLATVDEAHTAQTAAAIARLISLCRVLAAAAPSTLLAALEMVESENSGLRQEIDTLELRHAAFYDMVTDTLKSL